MMVHSPLFSWKVSAGVSWEDVVVIRQDKVYWRVVPEMTSAKTHSIA